VKHNCPYKKEHKEIHERDNPESVTLHNVLLKKYFLQQWQLPKSQRPNHILKKEMEHGKEESLQQKQ
jgi:hypothetical protein